jgi:hypothetical protein
MGEAKLDFDKVMQNFPLDKPRDIQVQAIRDIVTAFNKGAEYVVSEVPVGGGKSAIALALARTMGDSSYMLTLTEQLQEQYVKDFSRYGLETLKGRGKFNCTRLGGTETCADGKLAFEGKNSCPPEMCPYQCAKSRAFAAKHVVANYHSYLWNLGMSAGRKKAKGERSLDSDFSGDATRPLTIIDEAHATEGFLLDVVSLSVKLDKLPFTVAPPPDEKKAFAPYVAYLKEELLPCLNEYVSKGVSRGFIDPRTKEELSSLGGKVASVLAAHERGEEWVPEREEVRDGSGRMIRTSFALKPLYVSDYGRWLHGFGQRKLLMSGTVLDAHKLVTAIGLDPDKGDAFTYDSPFPVENRPIYVGKLDMSYKARDTSWPVMVEMVKGILTHHANEKGLLLCPSNAMIDHIAKNLPVNLSRRLLKASGENRMAKYQEHCSTKAPTVLAAPGFWEGADLRGDLSRFQIIPAVPRAFWGGQIEARATRDRGWYDWLNYTKLLQGFGRSVRSETDTAVTYLFDKEFRLECKKARSLIPQWVKASVQYVD